MAQISLHLVPKKAYDAWREQQQRDVTADDPPLGDEPVRKARCLYLEDAQNNRHELQLSGIEVSVDDGDPFRDTRREILLKFRDIQAPDRDIGNRLWFLVMGVFWGAVCVFSADACQDNLRAGSVLWGVLSGCLCLLTLLYVMAFLVVATWRGDGYAFEFPCLATHSSSKESLRTLRFRTGDVVVIGPEDFRGGWTELLAPGCFWGDRFVEFMSHMIGAYNPKVMDQSSHPVPPCVGAVILYTEEDWAIARYVRQNFSSLHFMSGLLLTLYFFEESQRQTKTPGDSVRRYWEGRIPERWQFVWSLLRLSRSKPYSKEAIDSFCKKVGVSPDALPCVLLFRKWKAVRKEREVIPIQGELDVFFRKLCGDVKEVVHEIASGRNPSAKIKSKRFWARFGNRWAARSERQEGASEGVGKPWRERPVPSVFLCHASVDKPFVEELARDLRSTGIDFWLDKWEIKVGNSIVEKIQDALEAQDFLIVVLSPESVSSTWVKKELTAALVRELEDRQVVILPVLFRETQIPSPLRDKLYADFTVNYTTGMETLLKRLSRSDRGRERQEPAKPLNPQ